MSEQQAELRFLVAADGAHHELPPKGSVTIGTGPASNDLLHFQAPGLDARHCVIGRTKSGGWALKDLGGQAGTQLNSKSITTARLKPGDELLLGDLSLRFSSPDFESKPREVKATPSLGQLGGFKLERQLGRGGMGEVVLAVQESLDRRVALKLLKSRLANDADFVRRFQTEAKHAAALNHPNVVHVYDVGIAGGRHYLAMEFMEGGTLEDRLKEGPMTVADVHRALVDTAGALAYAEERGIVHRDIKPENLMLDGTGRVKLADLGLATSSEGGAEKGSEKILGTPHFMAPEQARGAAVDHRADLYALGGTAYRLLTGKTPFQGATTRDILRAHFTEPAPSAKASVPEVPDALDAIILKLMEKEPANRFGSARELLTALTSAGASAAPKQTFLLPIAAAVILLGGAAFFFLNGQDQPGPNQPKDSEPVTNAGAPSEPKLPLLIPGENGGLPSIPEQITAEPEDNEGVFRKMEEHAQNAYRNLSPITEVVPRKAALQELIKAFPSSTTASQAQTEIDALDAVLAAKANADQSQANELDRQAAIILGITSKAPKMPDGAAQFPCAILVQLVQLRPPGDAQLLPVFETGRDEAIGLVITKARAHVQANLDAAHAASEVGDFDSFTSLLEETVTYFDLAALGIDTEVEQPSEGPGGNGTDESSAAQIPGGMPESSEPTDVFQIPEPPAEPAITPEQTESLAALGLTSLLGMRDQALALLTEKVSRQIAFDQGQRKADRLSFAEQLFAGANGKHGLGGDLFDFNFTNAEARLATLSQSLKTEAAQSAAGRLAFEAREAATVFSTVIEAHAKGEWRRNSVPHPSSGYGDVKSVTRTGLVLDLSSGDRAYAWADYHAHKRMDNLPGFVDSFFKNRLHRDYTQAEISGIASFARFCAVDCAIAEAELILVPGARKPFKNEHAQAMLTAFEVSQQWSQAVHDPAAMESTERELAAIRLLSKALSAQVADRPAVSAALLEELLNSHATSLTVLLLSNGGGAQ